MHRLPTSTTRAVVVTACLAAGLIAGAFARAGDQAIDVFDNVRGGRRGAEGSAPLRR